MLLSALTTSISAHAQDNEQKIQVSLTYNFLKYTTWPASSTASEDNNLHICMLGGDSFNGNLYALEGRTAQQRKIKIRLLNSSDEAAGCHILVIDKSQDENLPVILNYLKGTDILTISSISHFAQRGGMVEYSKGKDERIHLYINREALDSSNLQINKRLLNLAELERSE